MMSACHECCQDKQNKLPRLHLRSVSPLCHEYHAAWRRVCDDYHASLTTSQGWLQACDDFHAILTTSPGWLPCCMTRRLQWLPCCDDYHAAMTTSLPWLPCCHDYHADSWVQGRGCRQGFRRIFSFRGRDSVYWYYKLNDNWKYEILRIQLCIAIQKRKGALQYKNIFWKTLQESKMILFIISM